mmetsp:Transcript_22843/g.40460  ORF Transcript_22843/g.40460 Transcript_22843/m.40460 type:complete len:216 (+) Transcript_22843:850-1497(+)
MSDDFGGCLSVARVDNAKVLILRRGSKHRAIVAPNHILKKLGAVSICRGTLSTLNIPNLYSGIGRSCGEYVFSTRMIAHNGYLLLVLSQIHQRVHNVILKPSGRNSPNLDSAVITTCGKHVLIERVKVKVENRTLVTIKNREAWVELSAILKRNNSKSATSCCHGISHKNSVGLDVVVITCGRAGTKTMVLKFLLGRLAVDVPDLTCANEATHCA